MTSIYKSLENKIVIITGGSQGIGKSIVSEFVKQKSKVYFLDIDKEGALKLIDELEKYFEAYLQEEEEELDEMSTTASVPGYQTPYAFTGKKDKYEKRRKQSAETSTDNKIAKKTKKHTTTNESAFKRMMNQMNGLNEVSYRDYKKDPTSTPQQKVNRGIIQINKMLGEMERVVNNNIKLKTEMGVQSNHFWKSTGKRFRKINERMIRIANRLRELSQ